MDSFANETYSESYYDQIMKYRDPRLDGWFLMHSPVPITMICASYIYFVLKAGPEWMKNREPYTLRGVLIVYNALQSIFSAWLFYRSVEYWVPNIGLTCFKVDPNDRSDVSMWSLHLCYYYFLSKISELSDTVFFVLKKKQSHISLLHVFHHAIMPFSVWFGLRFCPGGNLAFFGLPNLFVHIWMYLYYMLAAMGPKYQKYVWWKRHITEMQLIQFALVMSYMLYISYACSLSPIFQIWVYVLDVVFVFLFTQFYKNAYRKRKEDTPINSGPNSVPNQHLKVQ